MVSNQQRNRQEQNFIMGKTGAWEVVIGMEVHAQLSCKTKLFSNAATGFGAAPNEQVSLIDAAMPGMLPVLNEECVLKAVRAGLGLNAKINNYSRFDRKNYFYPDLPQGYQISQFYYPIIGEGHIALAIGPDKSGNFDEIEIGIERIHLEQDAGKLLHDQDPLFSYLDLNRAGVALIEIVSKPDLRSSTEAKAYISKLRSLLRYLEVCDGNMDEGSLRADVNISVRRPGEELGKRCEIKNVNSIRFIGQAIEYEARRQIAILEEGKEVVQETRLFDPLRGETRSMRLKEDALDYRYFPDPDLLPLFLNDAYIEAVRQDLPELPDQLRQRMIRDFGLLPYDANILSSDKNLAQYFLAALRRPDGQLREGKLLANWIINELLGALNKENLSIKDSPITEEQLGSLIDFIQDGTISGKIAKEIFEILWCEGGDAKSIIKAKGLEQLSDSSAIEAAVNEIFDQYPDKVEQAKAKPALAGWFVGQVMKITQGKANPKMVDKLVKEKLGL